MPGGDRMTDKELICLVLGERALRRKYNAVSSEAYFQQGIEAVKDANRLRLQEEWKQFLKRLNAELDKREKTPSE